MPLVRSVFATVISLTALASFAACGDDEDVPARIDAAVDAPPAIDAPAVDPVARGRYLVDHVAACGDCHSPRNPDGSFQAGKELWASSASSTSIRPAPPRAASTAAT